MKNYISKKRCVVALPMSTELAIVTGYKVEDTVELHGYEIECEDGHKYWSPKTVFEKAYHATDSMIFGLAIEALKLGKRVARKGWNGKGMWLKLIEGRSIPNVESEFSDENGHLTIYSRIDMFSADQKQVVGWLASQTDMLAEDWVIVE